MIKAYTEADYQQLLTDPVKFAGLCWPDLTIYKEQQDILYSLRDNDETIVVAGNQLGKDFIAGLATVWFFCSRSPCRVVTSSAGETQLKSVLWGEMRRFINTSKYPLPIQYNDMLIRQIIDKEGNLQDRSYIQGIVTNVLENLLGHHLERGPDGKPRTLFVGDEASSIKTAFYDAADTWAHRKLIIGNPLPCVNFFYSHVKAGILSSIDGDRLFRNVMRIKAEDSPNVKLALAQKAKGKRITNEIIVPGVIDYATYIKRRATWDPIRQCVGLDAMFYEGAEVRLYPPEWLAKAETVAEELKAKRNRRARAIGVDTAEGGDSTVWAVVDHLGLMKLISKKTSDTSVITGDTIALMREYGVEPANVLFDAGGGGKQHVDRLRLQGYEVRSVAFGGAPTAPDVKRPAQIIGTKERREERENKYIYKNRRAELYGRLRYDLLDPAAHPQSFGIPHEYAELIRQLTPIPLLYNAEGQVYLPPKDKKDSASKEITLKMILGCSPDEADALVLATFRMLNPILPRMVGAAN